MDSPAEFVVGSKSAALPPDIEVAFGRAGRFEGDRFKDLGACDHIKARAPGPADRQWEDVLARRGCDKRIGMPKFEPPKPFSTATVTPTTLPCSSISGPPEPPEVVCASNTIWVGKTWPICPCVIRGCIRLRVAS